VREVILNAIIHKDYASSTPVQVSVYEDRLMIWNSGQLPDEWGVEDLLRKHPSKPSVFVNEVVCAVAMRIGRQEANRAA